uniref:Uncharacterized protein n=1 Tax=Astyanax mexicanus TaxID=7994 RepID=A0A3B1IDA1_ASTMX
MDDLDTHKFLQNCELPTLTQEDQDSLNTDPSVQEIQKTIKALNKGKAPGRSCSLFCIYKRRKMASHSIQSPTLNEAIITVLNQLIGQIVNSDQIPNIYSFYNLQRLFNIIYSQCGDEDDLV